MNSVDFFESIGMIEDEYVIEAEEYKKTKKTNRKKIFAASAAACLALCLCLGWILKPGMGNVPGHVSPDKQAALDSTPAQESNNERATSNEIMDNLNQYFSEHEIPDWFGNYYLENNNVYVLLADLDVNNKIQVQTWAKSEDILFRKTQYSYHYLISVFDSISNDMKNNQITFISSIWLDSKSNQIKVETNYEITSKEEEILFSYDKEGKGGVFDVKHNK